jgi:steroid delta-isomerase-like uncharacterized protein
VYNARLSSKFERQKFMHEATRQLIERYYAAFNAQDTATFLGLLADDIVHEINQGNREFGKDAFAQFIKRMNNCYRERVTDLVIMTDDDGARAAAEFTVIGTYVTTDRGLPPARGQNYQLSAGAFFSLRDGKILRIANYYNLQDWLAQVR